MWTWESTDDRNQLKVIGYLRYAGAPVGLRVKGAPEEILDLVGELNRQHVGKTTVEYLCVQAGSSHSVGEFACHCLQRSIA